MTLNQAIISRTTLTANASSMTLPIPSGYTDIKIESSIRGFSNIFLSLSFNGSSANFTSKQLHYDSGTPQALSRTDSFIGYGQSVGSLYADTFSLATLYIPNYTSSRAKTFSFDYANENNSSSAWLGMTSGQWNQTAAITSVTLTGDFLPGSTFTVYGITKFGVTPTQTPKATGGDIINNDGTYWYHAFLSTGAFIPQQTLSCDYLVVAGGGAGGGSWGGGGGAGGYRAGSALSLTANTMYAVAVGAGAAGANSNGANGGNSSISTITSAGGGGGGYYFDAGRAGGSGGGGAGGYGGLGNHGVGGAGNTPSTSPSQGNNGGEGYSPSDYSGNRYGGGGGGSAAAGASATSGSGGAGGAGTSNSITGTAVTYAAGGNGNALGGGAGAAGTGNGGSGGGESVAGANGGSGIVIVRYAMA